MENYKEKINEMSKEELKYEMRNLLKMNDSLKSITDSKTLDIMLDDIREKFNIVKNRIMEDE